MSEPAGRPEELRGTEEVGEGAVLEAVDGCDQVSQRSSFLSFVISWEAAQPARTCWAHRTPCSDAIREALLSMDGGTRP